MLDILSKTIQISSAKFEVELSSNNKSFVLGFFTSEEARAHMETPTLRASKSIAQSELQQLKETLRRLSLADDPNALSHSNSSGSLKVSSLLTPTAPSTPPLNTSMLGTSKTLHEATQTTPASASPTTRLSFATPMIPVHGRTASLSASAASNSKAVLSALKALQDKIRRVEDEKATVDNQVASLKAQIRSNEAQYLSASKKASYELDQVKEAAHAAYEALRIERDALVSDLNQERHHVTIKSNELDHANDMLTSYRDKADHADEQLKLLEAQLRKVQTELVDTNQSSKERILELQEALHASTRSGKEAARKIQSLEEQLTRVNDMNTSLDERLHDTEKTVAQMSQLNEKLVHNLWASKAKPKTAKSNKKMPAAPPPPIVTRSTAASRANRSSTAVAASTKSTKKKSTKSLKRAPAVNNLSQLEAANMGHVPFLLGKSTAPSFSVIGNAQEALRQSDAFHAVAPDIHPPVTLLKKKVVTIEDPEDASLQQPPSIDGDVEKPTKAVFMANISKAVHSVEHEFQALNNRYKVLMAQVDGKNPNMGKHIETTIDELEAKGEQLFLLKQLQSQASKSSIFASRRVLHSPDAADKKAAALRVLHEYRKLDREMKTRSPRAASSHPYD
ncbi:Aste57867_24486 [Aphanomyces stellatus]|uniref:Aste57867_24486 protein n=1 Tax=Aphanomyces stellatus TaxID=120398 RepID=A0A485LQS3_9STRA|nr:hypothetical protein As57867_024409 [Aphanomyces stellatus]VFU01125.1 Aste57867_24486 [Aphanomyces stellatus]